MAFDFPSSPVDGQVFSTTVGAWKYNASRGTWKRAVGNAISSGLNYNRIVNGAMQISQENGSTGASTDQYYPADCWIANNYANNTGKASFARVQGASYVSPRGSLNRLQASVTTAYAATDSYTGWVTRIEGTRIADLAFGTAAAKPTVLRFGFKGPAGTYGVSVISGDNAVSYVAPIVVPAGQANMDLEFFLAIPPCTTGGWPKTTGVGCRIFWTYYASSSYQTSNLNQWASGFFVCPTGMVPPASGTFQLFDVGWYADPNNTGLAPDFQCQHYEDDHRDCQRYWYRLNCSFQGITNAGNTALMYVNHFVPMASTPAFATFGNVQGNITLQSFPGSSGVGGSSMTANGVANNNSDTQRCDVIFTAATTNFVVGKLVKLNNATYDTETGPSYVSMNARL